MAKRDYYKVLDLPRTATEADVKKAYRRLAMKYHPDRNPGDKDAEEKFKEAKEAYEVLCESEKRAIYDQHGHAGIDASRQGESSDLKYAVLAQRIESAGPTEIVARAAELHRWREELLNGR